MELKGISYSDREFGSQLNLSGQDKGSMDTFLYYTSNNVKNLDYYSLEIKNVLSVVVKINKGVHFPDHFKINNCAPGLWR